MPRDVTIVVVGAEGSGKTTLINQLYGLDKARQSSILTKFTSYILNKEVKLKIWDLVEQQRKSLFPLYAKQAAAIYLCVDLTRADLFGHVAEKVGEIKAAFKVNELTMPIVIVGTKYDLVPEENKDSKVAELFTWAEENDCIGFKEHLTFKSIVEATIPPLSPALDRPITIERPTLLSQGAISDWLACLREVSQHKNIHFVTGIETLSTAFYKIQLQIEKILFERRNEGTSVPDTQLKSHILTLIDSRIQAIQNTKGILLSKSPQKIQAWLDLYRAIYLATDDSSLKEIINNWKTKTEVGNSKSNEYIIKDQRQYCIYFKPKITESEKILDLIEALAGKAITPSLTQTGGKPA